MNSETARQLPLIETAENDEPERLRSQATKLQKLQYRDHRGRLPPKTKSVVLYARFSPRPNADQCQSIKWQLDCLRAHAEKQGWKVVGEFEDAAEKGSDANRAGLWQAVSAAKEPGCAILVHRLDRLARDRWLFYMIEHELARSGACILSACGEGNGESPEDEMTRGIVVLLADFHRKMNNARMKAAIRHHRHNGLNLYNPERPLFGLMLDPTSPMRPKKKKPNELIHTRCTIDPQHWPIVALVFELRDRGLKTASILRAIRRRGMTARWTKTENGWISLIRDMPRLRETYVALSKTFAAKLKELGLEKVKPIAGE